MPRIWIVRDPTPESVMEDILSLTDSTENLVNLIRGSPEGCDPGAEHWCFYPESEEAAARADARGRLRYRDWIAREA